MSAAFQPLLFGLQLMLQGGQPALAAPARPVVVRPVVVRPAAAQPAQPTGPSAAAPAPATRPSAADLARRATDRAAAEVASVAASRSQTAVAKQRLARQYDAELAEIDRLKRGRASWRRDRQVAARKAAAQATARRLAVLDDELRRLEGRLVAGRRALVAAIDRELVAGGTRTAHLRALRAEIGAQVRPPARRLVLPDESLDELADPDELAEQIALLEQAEASLRGERQLLAAREDRYGRMARLREQRDRAAELSQPDEEAVRRTTGTAGAGRTADEASGAGSPSAEGDADAPSPGGDDQGLDGGGSPPPQDAPTGADDGAGFVASSVVLADVVDGTTAAALRRAGRSNDPRARAEAAARAREQVEARLQRLTRSRLLIQRHLRKLDR